MFTCEGNIGKSHCKLIWQKISQQLKISVTYSDETTEIEEIPEICSFRGTSNLTIQITPEDSKAKSRCFEESQADVEGMYLETESFEVLCEFNNLFENVVQQVVQKRSNVNFLSHLKV